MPRLLQTVSALLLAVVASTGFASEPVAFDQQDDRLVISVGNEPFAEYVFRDEKIPRPYFAHVKAPGSVQVTRSHPPVEGTDRTDHATMHPGIWLAFGDLDGADFWRNKARIEHVRFTNSPTGGPGKGEFIEEKRYLREDGSEICRERFRCVIIPRAGGRLLVWDSTFTGKRPFTFGDQEEMGLGMRVATPLSEVERGRLLDSEGRTGAEAIWSYAARWCDYSGTIDGRPVGMTLMSHPENFRESWLHARNYGFVAANPFGRKAMNKGPASQVTVEPGESLQLRFAVWIHSGNGGDPESIASAYDDFVTLTQASDTK
ncbi:hypothetical protein Mal4_09970 [Maioricimonas rarisocia]|uniref:Methane oxygenase PmoA n=1 Tax=Maioricimonas rarisocia TaxID=2528026 RepID=A0A517Z2L4_9PLAN|nr:PmoA family protein [Maioricimonas rarisocia]QDU36708.1 hypothetical protein Mal4_09970 [Maioricimonas rarisocia]